MALAAREGADEAVELDAAAVVAVGAGVAVLVPPHAARPRAAMPAAPKMKCRRVNAAIGRGISLPPRCEW
jgi:hypothetical protein